MISEQMDILLKEGNWKGLHILLKDATDDDWISFGQKFNGCHNLLWMMLEGFSEGFEDLAFLAYERKAESSKKLLAQTIYQNPSFIDRLGISNVEIDEDLKTSILERVGISLGVPGEELTERLLASGFDQKTLAEAMAQGGLTETAEKLWSKDFDDTERFALLLTRSVRARLIDKNKKGYDVVWDFGGKYPEHWGVITRELIRVEEFEWIGKLPKNQSVGLSFLSSRVMKALKGRELFSNAISSHLSFHEDSANGDSMLKLFEALSIVLESHNNLDEGAWNKTIDLIHSIGIGDPGARAKSKSGKSRSVHHFIEEMWTKHVLSDEQRFKIIKALAQNGCHHSTMGSDGSPSYLMTLKNPKKLAQLEKEGFMVLARETYIKKPLKRI